jgi:MinD-like ATPase involved in chromosome partitioning or flagellar assembly
MALVNVAADLLARGRKVLLVDFDLEAPGLDTFPMTLDRPVRGGLVEMITDYLDSSSESTPSVLEYVYGAKLDGVENGSLWIMPAGCQDSSYDSRFRSIDWQDFYEEQGGFLFFEDMKAQWMEALDPDYVLIDSRTGHTDIGGICTRQLPDCVVAVFFPNEQNLRGLAPVVQDVRKEKHGPLNKTIDIHFVMGNVPDLDDEDAILSEACSSAERMLLYKELAATIHHFNSLSMLTQRLLIVDRPRSKVAAEYRLLANVIVRGNLEDRDGAISVLNHVLAELQSGGESPNDRQLEDRLRSIRDRHSSDAEVLQGLAKFRRAQRRNEEALELFDQILELNESDSESLVGRAEIETISRNTDAAVRDLASFFKLERVSPFAFGLAARLMITNDQSRISDMLQSPAIPTLPGIIVSDLIQDLQKRYETCDYGVSLARRWSASNSADDWGDIISLETSLCLIGAGRFLEAQLEIDQHHRGVAQLDLADSFNYAMAEWGLSGGMPKELFEGIVRMVEKAEDEVDVNRLQCFSLVYWALGDSSRAMHLRDEAAARFASAPRTTFSAWSYLYRSPTEFRSDLDAMSAAYNAGEVKPAFIRETGHLV